MPLRSLSILCVLTLLNVSVQAEPESRYEKILRQQGEWLFQKNCAFCHERDGRGSVGPNLTDWYFLYGPTRKNMRFIIENGVLPKGMPVWKETLSQAELRAVEEYVWSLRGKELPGKEPQGGHYPDGEETLAGD